MLNNYKKEKLLSIKATIIDIIVAFALVVVLTIAINVLAGSQVKAAISLINRVSVDTSKKTLEEINFDQNSNKLTSYPEYGAMYGNIIIDSIGVNLQVYYGDSLSILKNGVGHSSGSYFPGEGGSIVYMGHNTSGFLRKLPEIKNGEIIQVNTVYGNYKYKVYDTKIVEQTNLQATPIQNNEEILMLYTCYPVNGVGHAKNRFIAYAKLVQE